MPGRSKSTTAGPSPAKTPLHEHPSGVAPSPAHHEAATPAAQEIATMRGEDRDAATDGAPRPLVPWFHDPAAAESCVERTVDGIAYRIHGDEAAATTRCVMVQGVAASMDNNLYMLRALKRPNLCVVVLDNVGIGHSIAPPERKEYTVERMADDVKKVTDDVGWADHRAHVVGHSMGGMVAMAYAARWPERVASVALLSTSAKRRPVDGVPNATAAPNAVRLVRAKTREERVAADLAFHFARSYLDGAFSEDELAFFEAAAPTETTRRDFWTREYLAADAQRASDAQPKAALDNQLRAAMRWKLSSDGLQALRDVDVLVAHGTDDLVCRPSGARALHRALLAPPGACCGGCCVSSDAVARARLLMIPRAAHMITSSHAVQVAAAVSGLWESVDGWMTKPKEAWTSEDVLNCLRAKTPPKPRREASATTPSKSPGKKLFLFS
mmetsp:Transcript_20183/g.62187  ORF Transcript_20183/g.62187 Transcript_20183/m.62187 type:complete len:441 (+) Transcript_20183:367-1689(+)